jgi:TNF receptor-associated factor 4
MCNECILAAGTLIWKISDYTSKFTEAKTKEGMELVSPPFYTSQYGYKLQVWRI